MRGSPPFTRWLMFSAALLLSSLALATDHGNSSPSGDCTFEKGQTVCVEVVQGNETLASVSEAYPADTCLAADSQNVIHEGLLWGQDWTYQTVTTTTTTTYKGKGPNIESQVVDVAVATRTVFKPLYCDALLY